jgi:hypothetical protein
MTGGETCFTQETELTPPSSFISLFIFSSSRHFIKSLARISPDGRPEVASDPSRDPSCEPFLLNILILGKTSCRRLGSVSRLLFDSSQLLHSPPVFHARSFTSGDDCFLNTRHLLALLFFFRIIWVFCYQEI